VPAHYLPAPTVPTVSLTYEKVSLPHHLPLPAHTFHRMFTSHFRARSRRLHCLAAARAPHARPPPPHTPTPTKAAAPHTHTHRKACTLHFPPATLCHWGSLCCPDCTAAAAPAPTSRGTLLRHCLVRARCPPCAHTPTSYSPCKHSPGQPATGTGAARLLLALTTALCAHLPPPSCSLVGTRWRALCGGPSCLWTWIKANNVHSPFSFLRATFCWALLAQVGQLGRQACARHTMAALPLYRMALPHSTAPVTARGKRINDSPPHASMNRLRDTPLLPRVLPRAAPGTPPALCMDCCS